MTEQNPIQIEKNPLINILIKDKLFLYAICAGVAFWLVLFAFNPLTPDLSWPASSPVKFLLLVLVYPVLEEIVFRGLIQGWLQERLVSIRVSTGIRISSWAAAWHGLTLANVITSCIFMALHFIQHQPLWAAAVFIPSIVFGFFKDRYQSLVPGIVLHCFYNLIYFWLFYRP